eukprot:356656-Chlamydomonas_euryale.AAC.1
MQGAGASSYAWPRGTAARRLPCGAVHGRAARAARLRGCGAAGRRTACCGPPAADVQPMRPMHADIVRTMQSSRAGAGPKRQSGLRDSKASLLAVCPGPGLVVGSTRAASGKAEAAGTLSTPAGAAAIASAAAAGAGACSAPTSAPVTGHATAAADTAYVETSLAMGCS